MKNILVILIAFLTPFIVMSQNIKYWEDGPLDNDDFKGENLAIDSMTGSAYFDQLIVDQTTEINGIATSNQIFKAIFYTNKSWINEEYENDFTVNYFPILFDIEHVACLWKKKLLLNKNQTSNDYYIIEKEKNIDIEQFVTESDAGQRIEILLKWENRLKEEIEKFNSANKEYISELKYYSKWGMDVLIGGGFIQNTSAELKEHISNPLGISFGIDVNLNKNYLVLAGIIGISKNDKDMVEYPFWKNDINVNYSVFSLSYGRLFRLSNNIKIIPFVGPTMANLAIANPRQYELVYENTSDTEWRIGGCFMQN